MEIIRLVNTEDRFAAKKSGFSHKKNQCKRKYLASFDEGGDGGGSNSSDREKEGKISEKGGALEEIVKVVLVA